MCAECNEEVTPPVSRAEKQLARQSLRRARQREVDQKRNMEESEMISDAVTDSPNNVCVCMCLCN